MPEIKNNFLQGRMNKDLDERLVPNGEYREAVNVEVSTSEGSDVGTVQNIKGNLPVGADIPSYFKCVGMISDEKSEKIYLFLSASDRDAIVEYDAYSNSSKNVLVDLFKGTGDEVLGFTNKIITGINIVDNFLMFSDGVTEPKILNITRCKEGAALTTGGPNSFNHHTYLVIDGVVDYYNSEDGFVKREHITVVKKRPTNAPVININTKEKENSTGLFEKTFLRFALRYKYADNQYSAIGPFTPVVFNPEYKGDYNVTNAYTAKESHNKAMTNSIDSIDVYDFVPFDIPADVVQVDILYKQENSTVIYTVASIKKTDSEWSELGSWSNEWQTAPYFYNAQGEPKPSNSAALQADYPGITQIEEFITFNATSNNKGSKHRGKYTVKTENIYAAIPANQIIRPFDAVPRKALAQEITGNRLVYGNYTQGYNMLDDVGNSIDVKLESSYEKRFLQDNFSKKGLPTTKSMRDYQVGVVFGDYYGRETPVLTSDSASAKIPWENNSYKNASEANILTSFLNTSIPYWADYYRFYVKEPSGEYYNLLMQNAYTPVTTDESSNKDEHVWLAFNSADRGKVMDEDYITIKKVISPEASQISSENKYKILAISNEAPDAIAYGFTNFGTVANSSTNDPTAVQGQLDDGGGQGANGTAGVIGGSDAIFPTEERRIDQRTKLIDINMGPWRAAGGMQFVDLGGPSSTILSTQNYQGDLYISWKLINSGVTQVRYSKRYKVDSVSVGSSNTTVTLNLKNEITVEDADLVTYVSGDQLLYATVFTIERKQRLDGTDFSGKFFVKVAKDDILRDNILEKNEYRLDGSNNSSFLTDPVLGVKNYNIASKMNTYWFADKREDSTINDQTLNPGVFNSLAYASDPDLLPSEVTGHSGAGATGSNSSGVADWQAIKDDRDSAGNGTPYMFIDNMYFRSVQTSSNTNYAKYAGQGHVANPQPYQEISWGEWNYGDEFDADGNPISFIGWGTPDPIKVLDANGDSQNFGSNYIMTTPFYKNETARAAGWSGEFALSKPENWSTGKIVNSMPGIVTLDANYDTSGSKAWVYEIGDTVGDDTYEYEEGSDKHYIHLSFLAPGADLHNGDFADANYLTSVDLSGPNSIAKEMQGIWGGGVATHREGLDWIVEFEGNYSSNGQPLLTAPGPGVGKGYDLAYQTLHERQWDPTFPNDQNGQIKNFLDRLIPGQKFKFAADTGNTIYMIKSVKVKKLYNHTPWFSEYQYSGTTDDTLEWQKDSVEKEAASWGYWRTADPGGTNEQNAATALREKIVNFGKATNRRVCFIIEVDKDPKAQSHNPVAGGVHPQADMNTSAGWQFLEEDPQPLSNLISTTSAVFETEPKKSADLNLFHETDTIVPTRLDATTREYFAPRGSRVEILDFPEARVGLKVISDEFRVRSFGDYEYNVDTGLGGPNAVTVYSMNRHDSGFNYYDENDNVLNYVGKKIRFYRKDGSYTTSTIVGHAINSDYMTNNRKMRNKFIIDSNIDPSLSVGISFSNAFAFGDGVESNRIRDDFNEMTIANGPKVSTTIDLDYQEENRTNGLIYSGIYNSGSSVNNFNQFIIGEKITKDINPTYGSIQKLFSRKTDLITLCEDKVLKILANKDALFNADGNPQLVSSNNVLGQSIPFVGDYGISKNPESFASESYRAYFTDSQRGSVIRLSMDGLTPISEAGMHDYFRDNLTTDMSLIGTYDDYKREYNLTLASKIDFPELIQNSYVEGGSPLIQQSTSFANLLMNGALGGGNEYEEENASLLTQPSENLFPNPYFSHKVFIRNFQPIPIGSIVQADPGAEGQEYIPPTYEQGELLEEAIDAVIGVSAAYTTYQANLGYDHGARIHRAELSTVSAPPHLAGTDGHPFFIDNPQSAMGQYVGVSNQDSPSSHRAYYSREVKHAAHTDTTSTPQVIHSYDGNTFVEYTGLGGGGFNASLPGGNNMNSLQNEWSSNNKAWEMIDPYSGNSFSSDPIDVDLDYNSNSNQKYYMRGGFVDRRHIVGWTPNNLFSDGFSRYHGVTRSGPKIWYDYGNVLADENATWINEGANDQVGYDNVNSTNMSAQPSTGGIVFGWVGRNDEARVTFPNYMSTTPNDIVSTPVLAAFPNAKNNTFFHGERVYITFRFRYIWSDLMSNFQHFKFEVLDGSTLISSDFIDGAVSNTNGFITGNIGAGLDQSNPSNGDVVSRTISGGFTFKDPNLTSSQISAGLTDSIVVQNLKVRITLVGSSGKAMDMNISINDYHKAPTTVVVDKIDVSKTKKLTGTSTQAVTGVDAVYGPDVLVDPGQEGISAGTGATAPVPSVSVPGWAQVFYRGETPSMDKPEHWQSSSGVDFYWGSKQIYGEETSSASSITESGNLYYVPPGMTLANASDYQDNSLGGGLYSWDGNDVVGYNDFVLNNGNDASSGIYTESQIRIGDYPAENKTATFGDIAKAKTIVASGSAYYTSDITESKNLGDWYMIDFEHDESYSNQFTHLSANAVLDYNVVTENSGSGSGLDAYGLSHLDTESNSYPLYPKGSFGEIGGGNAVGTNKSLMSMPALRTEYGQQRPVMRSLYKYVDNSYSYENHSVNQAISQAWFNATTGGSIVLTSMHMFNVSGSETLAAEPASWGTLDANYTTDAGNSVANYRTNFHQIKTVEDLTSNETVVLSYPSCYWKNNSLCFNVPNEDTNAGKRYWTQDFVNTQNYNPNTQGYTLDFTVASNPDTNTINGDLYLRLGNEIGQSALIDSSLDASRFYGVLLDNITEAGDYSISFNYNESAPQILVQPPNSNMTAQTPYQGGSGTLSGHANKLVLSAGHYSNSYFTGSINSFYLTDNTNYFTGGGVDFWTFGEENGVPYNELQNPYMFWDFGTILNVSSVQSGFITISGAPESSTLEQAIDVGEASVLDQVFLVSFDYSILDGGIQFSFFTEDGGFVDTIIGPGSGTYSQALTIDSASTNPVDGLINTFHVQTVGSSTTGTLDNFSMRRQITSIEETTISFSEKAKGWVSFKDFVPETGVSLGKQYFTTKSGQLYQHHANEIRNNFYGVQYSSSIEFLLNNSPSTIKSFNTFNYEGSQAYNERFTTNNSGASNVSLENFINGSKTGWYVTEVSTDLESGSLKDFVEKEGKWFGYPIGSAGGFDPSALNTQGLGFVLEIDNSMHYL